jgi:hypothetical protein
VRVLLEAFGEEGVGEQDALAALAVVGPKQPLGPTALAVLTHDRSNTPLPS